MITSRNITVVGGRINAAAIVLKAKFLQCFDTMFAENFRLVLGDKIANQDTVFTLGDISSLFVNN